MKKFNVWDHYNERESWTCQLCDEEIEANDSLLILHLREKHDVEVEE